MTWNSAPTIARALEALSRELDSESAEIIVIDNGSVDESLEIVRRVTPQARVVRNATNLGVARARNQGIALARGRYLLLLDSDAEPAAGSVREMVGFMETSPGVGLLGPRLVSPDGTVQFSCRRFPTLQGKILRQLPWRAGRAIAILSDEEMHQIDRTVPRRVDYVIGACQLIRAGVVERIGLLDERMFYGPEDVDFCLRVWRAGWEVVYLPSAVVVHHEQRITRRRPGVLTLKHGLALARYFWKHRYLWHRPIAGQRSPPPGE